MSMRVHKMSRESAQLQPGLMQYLSALAVRLYIIHKIMYMCSIIVVLIFNIAEQRCSKMSI